MLTVKRKNEKFAPETGDYEIDALLAKLTPVSGRYMIRINGWPLYIVGSAISLILDRTNNAQTVSEDLQRTLLQGKAALETFIALPYLPVDAKITGGAVLQNVLPLIENPDPPDLVAKKAALNYSIMQFNTMLASSLFWFDLYWIQPKLGLNTTAIMSDASVVFPPSIKAYLPDPVKYEVQQAANCLLYEAPSAVGFHVLRAVEVVILSYFTIPGVDRSGANTWADYTKVLRGHGVHRKIVAMVDRLATLHRNELMHAEAVLTKEEASMLFALMQEVLPIMIADVAKRRGTPIADFPILDDPRWQPKT
jgi:hypothetical protein